MRVVIADDSVLLREGLQRLLTEAGIEVVATVGDGDALLRAVEEYAPDLAVIDIRMPPTYTHEGAESAARLRTDHPEIGLLLLSQAIERRYALRLAQNHPTGFGYLLKDRVLDVSTLLESMERVRAGGTVLDSEIVAHFLSSQASQDRVAVLSERERAVLALMAEGRSNGAIAQELFVTEKTVDSHITAIFSKLGLLPQAADHRRVLAVRAWLATDLAMDADITR